MSIGSDVDYSKVMFGQHAVHVPAWFWVQDGGPHNVVIAGASRMPAPHPLRYGSERTHQLIVGEMVVRPHLVIGTDEKRGAGISGMLTDNGLWGDPDIILDPFGRGADLLKEILR